MSEKVYIVSAGSYSDRYIKKIFKSKEKAEFYHKHNNDYDLNDIEEYELSDDNVITPVYYVEAVYSIGGVNHYGKYQEEGFKLNILSTNTEDYRDVSVNRIYINSGYSGYEIRVCRELNNEVYDSDKLNAKFLKVCQDYAALIKNELVNGASIYDIQRMFRCYGKDLVDEQINNRSKD